MIFRRRSRIIRHPHLEPSGEPDDRGIGQGRRLPRKPQTEATE